MEIDTRTSPSGPYRTISLKSGSSPTSAFYIFHCYKIYSRLLRILPYLLVKTYIHAFRFHVYIRFLSQISSVHTFYNRRYTFSKWPKMKYYVSLIYMGWYSVTNRFLMSLSRPPAAPCNWLSLVYLGRYSVANPSLTSLYRLPVAPCNWLSLVYLGRYIFANRSLSPAAPCNWLSLV